MKRLLKSFGASATMPLTGAARDAKESDARSALRLAS
jgi:hypothetical protein